MKCGLADITVSRADGMILIIINDGLVVLRMSEGEAMTLATAITRHAS